jgi:hypothetical protein
MNHVLKMADTSAAAQKDAYTNPDLPLSPKLVSDVVSFVAPLAIVRP